MIDYPKTLNVWSIYRHPRREPAYSTWKYILIVIASASSSACSGIIISCPFLWSYLSNHPGQTKKMIQPWGPIREKNVLNMYIHFKYIPYISANCRYLNIPVPWRSYGIVQAEPSPPKRTPPRTRPYDQGLLTIGFPICMFPLIRPC